MTDVKNLSIFIANRAKGFPEKSEAGTQLDFFPAVRKQVSLALLSAS